MKPLNMKPNENFAALSWHFFFLITFFGCKPMIKYAVLLFCLTKNQSFDWNWTLNPPDDLPKRIMLTLFSFFLFLKEFPCSCCVCQISIIHFFSANRSNKRSSQWNFWKKKYICCYWTRPSLCFWNCDCECLILLFIMELLDL